MLDQLLGVVLLGLGLQNPMSPPMVKGDTTEQSQSGSGRNRGADRHSQESSEEAGSSGVNGATGVSGTNSETESHTSSETAPVMIGGIPSNIPQERRDMYKKEMEKRKADLETKRKALDAQFKQKREALKTSLSESKDVYRTQKRNGTDVKARTEEEKAAFLESVKAKIEETAAQREEKMAALKDKVKSFRSQDKKEKVEDIQSKITSFVTKRLSTLTNQITKMTDIVALNKTQVTEKGTGKDTSAFDTAASKALSSINTAKDMLSSLSSKQFIVTVNSESTVKSDVESVRKNIDADMKSMNESMKNARVAVSVMITERAKLLGEPIPDAVIK